MTLCFINSSYTHARMENQAQYHILLAEDNLFNQKVAVAMLKKLSLTVDVAGNGQEVLDRLPNASYKLIFMDCEMPVMNGYEATEKIRQSYRQTYSYCRHDCAQFLRRPETLSTIRHG